MFRPIDTVSMLVKSAFGRSLKSVDELRNCLFGFVSSGRRLHRPNFQRRKTRWSTASFSARSRPMRSSCSIRHPRLRVTPVAKWPFCRLNRSWKGFMTSTLNLADVSAQELRPSSRPCGSAPCRSSSSRRHQPLSLAARSRSWRLHRSTR